jgi:hypothetical protein
MIKYSKTAGLKTMKTVIEILKWSLKDGKKT